MYSIREDISKWPVEKRMKKLEELYIDRIGESLSFSNPNRFTEKIQWMKIYYSSPEIVQCIDKLTFKDYVNKHLGPGYTARVYRIWNAPEEVDFTGLPNSCVIKSNCSTEGRNMRLIRDWSQVNQPELLAEIKNQWFDRRLLCTNSFITAYHQVTPAVFVEELIPGFSDASEYKIFCFNGEPKCLYVPGYEFINGVESSDFSLSFYSPEWEFMNLQFGDYEFHTDLDKPHNLNRMLEIAKDLAKDFMFVRVDFVDTREGLYLSEMTFYPSGGLIPFHPIEADELLGSWLTLDKRFIKGVQ